MALLGLARAAQREFERSQRQLGDALRQIGHGYGDGRGVAHAAEIAPAQHDAFVHYWAAGELCLPPRPPPRPKTPPPRRAWAREPFSYYAGLDERHDVAASRIPGGDPGQGPSRSNDERFPSASPAPSEDPPAESEEEEEVVPPSPPQPRV
jgi:hypothetical protein